MKQSAVNNKNAPLDVQLKMKYLIKLKKLDFINNILNKGEISFCKRLLEL